MLKAIVSLAFTVFLFLPGSPVSAQSDASAPAAHDATQEWQERIQRARAAREREIAAPEGWLTLIALDWLKPGITSFGTGADNKLRINARGPDHMGMLTVSGSTVQLLSPRGGFPPDLMLDGQPAREGTLSTGDEKPSKLTWRGLTMVVLLRGDRYVLRVKDADASPRMGFHGLHWYAPNLHYAVEARWIPYNPPHTEKIATVVGTTLSLPAPGVAEFTLDGKTLRLEPVLESPDETMLFFILRDATSQSTTYQAGRFLHTTFPDHGLAQPGTLILDFNQLYNPPCAYTPFATCPLPPEQNRLPVSIEAGEQRYTP